jgi:hypothetical protein
MSVNLLFEIVNGSWSIGLAFFIVFLVHYLFENRIDRDMTFRQWITGVDTNRDTVPHVQAAQVAIALLIADSGNLIVRGSIWIWRETTGGIGTIPPSFVYPVIIGGVIGAVGILCKLRVFSVRRFGHGPWVACATTIVMFIAYKMVEAFYE